MKSMKASSSDGLRKNIFEVSTAAFKCMHITTFDTNFYIFMKLESETALVPAIFVVLFEMEALLDSPGNLAMHNATNHSSNITINLACDCR